MKSHRFALLVVGILAVGGAVIYFAPQAKSWLDQRARDAEIAEWVRETKQAEESRTLFRARLARLRVDRVYYIDVGPAPAGGPKPTKLHRYRVISASDSLPPSASNDLKSSLGRMLDTSPEFQAMCFIPHHAVSMTDGTDTFDVLVCFNCNNYEVRSSVGNFGGAFSADERATWDRIFASGGLALPSEARQPEPAKVTGA